MSEQKSDTTQPAQVEVVNSSRRKLTSAALAGPVVLGTLASKQVLASGGIAYQCTVSGQISNTSSPRPGEGVSCILGVSPGCWKNKKTSCYKPNGEKVSVDCTPRYPTPYTPDTLFSTVFGHDPCGTGTTTLWQMLGSGSNSICSSMDTTFARVCAASLLSAAKWYSPGLSTSYPLTTTQVVGLYKIGAGLGGTPFHLLFQGVNPGTTWNKAQIQTYLESLYGGAEQNDCPAGGNTP